MLVIKRRQLLSCCWLQVTTAPLRALHGGGRRDGGTNHPETTIWHNISWIAGAFGESAASRALVTQHEGFERFSRRPPHRISSKVSERASCHSVKLSCPVGAQVAVRL